MSFDIPAGTGDTGREPNSKRGLNKIRNAKRDKQMALGSHIQKREAKGDAIAEAGGNKSQIGDVKKIIH